MGTEAFQNIVCPPAFSSNISKIIYIVQVEKHALNITLCIDIKLRHQYQ